jgi:hypothetical protein
MKTRLIHGECLSVLPTLGLDPARTVLITDPPYGIGVTLHKGYTGETVSGRYVELSGDDSQAAGVAVLAWAESQNLPTAAFADPQNPWPGEWRQHLVWDKGDAVGGLGDYRRTWKRTWELIQIARNGPLLRGRDAAVLRFPAAPGRKAHPAEKSVELLAYLIRQLVPPGGVVLDPFMGSGTTGVACVREGRDFIGVEINEEYFAVAQRRINEAEAYRDGTGGELFAGLAKGDVV